MTDSRVNPHVDSRAYGGHVDSRSYVEKPEQSQVDLNAVRAIVQVEVARAIQNAEHLRGSQGLPGDKWQAEEVHAVVEQHVANSPALRGAVGPQGEPGRDGQDAPSMEQIRELVQKELRANAGLFRGLPGRDSTVAGVAGRDGVDGKNGVDGQPGRDGRDGKDGVNGSQGLQGPAGRDAQEPLSLDQIIQAVRQTVHDVLANTPLPVGRIIRELHSIDHEADSRPSLRPIYSSMTDRIRNILKDAE